MDVQYSTVQLYSWSTELSPDGGLKGGKSAARRRTKARPARARRPAAMISALLFINQKGEVVISRMYRDFNKAQADTFRNQVRSVRTSPARARAPERARCAAPSSPSDRARSPAAHTLCARRSRR